MFLIPQDYEQIIRTEILSTISGSKSYNIDGAESTAISEMESYLSSRYDVAKIFVHVQPWQETTQYEPKDYVWHTGPGGMAVIYVAMQANQGTNPFTPEAPWLPNDPRHALIRTYLTDMAVYHAHAAIPHKSIPELRVLRYEAAIAWLKMVNAGQLTPNLPLLPADGEDGEGSPTDNIIRLGSRPKLRHDR